MHARPRLCITQPEGGAHQINQKATILQHPTANVGVLHGVAALAVPSVANDTAKAAPAMQPSTDADTHTNTHAYLWAQIQVAQAQGSPMIDEGEETPTHSHTHYTAAEYRHVHVYMQDAAAAEAEPQSLQLLAVDTSAVSSATDRTAADLSGHTQPTDNQLAVG